MRCGNCRARSVASSLLGAMIFALASPTWGQVESDNKAFGGRGSGADQNSPKVKRINEEIRRVWDDHKLRPSPAATDGEWCRRLYLDVLGRVPSVEELRD